MKTIEYKRVVDEIWEYCEWLNQMKQELRDVSKRPKTPRDQQDVEEDDLK